MKRLRTKGLLTVAALAAAVAGCGSSGGGGASGSGTVNGTIQGMQIKVADAIFDNVTAPGPAGGNGSVTTIFLSNYPSSCSTLITNGNPKSTQVFVLGLFNQTAGGQTTFASAPGTFTVTNPPGGSAGELAEVGYSASDATCNMTAGATGTSGTVTVTAVSSSSISGTFNVTMSTGDKVTGSFTAASCPGIGTALNSNADAGACR